MISEQDRLNLYNRLADVVGPEEASTMMELFPPSSWEAIATNDHVDRVAAELQADIRILHTKIDERYNTFDARISSLDTKIDERFTTLDTKIDERAAALVSKIDERFNTLDTKIDERFTTLDTKIDERFNTLDTKIDERTAALVSRIDALESGIDSRLSNLQTELTQAMMRNLKSTVAANNATMLALAAILVAALKI